MEHNVEHMKKILVCVSMHRRMRSQASLHGRTIAITVFYAVSIYFK